MRNIVLWAAVFGVFTYTWKDWYRGLCGLIALLSIMEHPDVPKQMLGIPGLNPFNLLLANVMAAWFVQRKNEGLRWDLPRTISVLLVLSVGVVVFGFVKMMRADIAFMMVYYDASIANLASDFLINSIKFAIPAILLYDGCRTEERFRLALISILFVYFFLGVQVAKWMPPNYALDGDALDHRGLRVLASGIGFHRVNLSAMLSGASWAILSTRELFGRGKRWPIVLLALFVIYAQVMTGGRAGYGAWLAVGLIMSLLKWRRYMLLVPAALAIVVVLAPGVMQRATRGFSSDTHETSQRINQLRREGEMAQSDGEVDAYTVTAGRSIAWPMVIEKIKERPWLGWGRQAMLSSGLALQIYNMYNDTFPHPHNAYLEMFFDNGFLGAAPILILHFLFLAYSVRMFLGNKSPTCVAIGGVSTAFLLSLLVSAFGSQSFYPEEGWVGMWCAMFLMLRVRTERLRLAATQSADAEGATHSEPRPVFNPFLRPAPAAGPVLRTSNGPIVPSVTWRKRGVATQPPPSAPVVAKPAVTHVARSSTPRFRPALPMLPTKGIACGGFFGRRVFDPLVWERA
jgi:O-antigen ligase